MPILCTFLIFNWKLVTTTYSVPWYLVNFTSYFTHHLLVPILTPWATKLKYEPPLTWHRVLQNMVSEDWWDSNSGPSRSQIIHQQWCKNVDQGWPHFLENFKGKTHWAYIQDNKDRWQTGEKVLLNHNTYDWTHYSK